MPEDNATEPDWDTPLSLTITPAMLIHALMQTAGAVHTGWSSCIDEASVLSSLVAMDDHAGCYVRLAEQEFAEESQPEVIWHDWTLEIRIGSILTTGHWQFPVNAHPSEWEWNAREATKAFERAAVLLGRRTRPTIAVEEPTPFEMVPRSSRH